MTTNNENTIKRVNNREECKYCCNKLSSFDWLNELHFVRENDIPDYVEVRFKSIRKCFCRNENKLKLYTGETVVVETPTGYDIGIVGLVSNLVKLQMKKKGISYGSEEVLPIVRLANERDKATWSETKKVEYETMIKAREISKELGLQMKIDDVEYQYDKKKVTFYYTAEGRVDFRELIKIFAKTFHSKIEMRQIGIRQESARVGGIGDCGRELCCSSWLTEFHTVPTIAARQQNLYLNPGKLSGQCSRLKCCLNYELDAYFEKMENFPPDTTIIATQKGNAKVFKMDILKEIMYFGFDNVLGAELIPIHINDVKKLIEMNKNNIIPSDLSEWEQKTADKVSFVNTLSINEY